MTKPSRREEKCYGRNVTSAIFIKINSLSKILAVQIGETFGLSAFIRDLRAEAALSSDHGSDHGSDHQVRKKRENV